jgi:hypothetical protein
VKYRDVVNYENLNTVIQLRNADNKEEAKKLVQTFVVSSDMKENFDHVIVPQLQFDQPKDNKGIFIIGNYGTGKSHLMSYISSIAEDSSLLDLIGEENIRESFSPIAGKFKVLRSEIGSTNMSLHEIITQQITEYFESIDVSFQFPPLSESPNQKYAFENMMYEFHKKYPNEGFMMVVDELLDYLRSRKDFELAQDLSFLREIGEVCEKIRFRFIAGIQEAIFENPRFEFASSNLRRVKDRFEQVNLSKNDIKFVVSQRLLKKNSGQKDAIKKYLSPFAKYYSNVSYKLDEFIDLFPIHPEYFQIFDQMTIIENRSALKTISSIIEKKLDEEIPTDFPGVVSYDSYWNFILNDSSASVIPDIRECKKISQNLESRIKASMERKANVPNALRIIHALSIHRLTTEDVDTPIGPTSTELKNDLLLFNQTALLGGDPEADLLTHVESILKQILKTVNGQFITYNDNNGQYYLDLKKNEDYDQKIENKAETIDDSTLDKYYFQIMKQLMEQTDTTYKSDFFVWQYYLLWKEKKVQRCGYLFLNTPNERPTTLPPRDFYIYFIQPFNAPVYKDEKKSDELIIELVQTDEEFTTSLKKLSASKQLGEISSGNERTIYQEKVKVYQERLFRWFKRHADESLSLTYAGKKRTLLEWSKKVSNNGLFSQNQTDPSFKKSIDSIASYCFSPYFKDTAPHYPRFPEIITHENIEQAANKAIDTILHIVKDSSCKIPKQSNDIFQALNFFHDNKFLPNKSVFAIPFLQLLDTKNKGKLLNYHDFLVDKNGTHYMDLNGERLEIEWVLVLLIALVSQGDIVLHQQLNKSIDVLELNNSKALTIADVENFDYVKKTEDWDMDSLRNLLQLLALPEQLVRDITLHSDTTIQNIQDVIAKKMDLVIEVEKFFGDGILLFQINILQPPICKIDQQNLRKTKDFLDSLSKYNTPGKFKRFTLPSDDFEQYHHALVELDAINMINKTMLDIQKLVNYIDLVSNGLPADNEWVASIQDIKNDFQNKFSSFSMQSFTQYLDALNKDLSAKKEEYINLYTQLHNKYRLNAEQDEYKKRIINGETLQALMQLQKFSFLDQDQCKDLLHKLQNLQSCFQLNEEDIEKFGFCQRCNFRPRDGMLPADNAALTQLESQAEKIIQNWKEALLNSMQDPVLDESIKLLDEPLKKELQEFKQAKKIPTPVTDTFILAFNTARKGLKQIDISSKDFLTYMREGQAGLTPEQAKARFNEFIDRKIAREDSAKVRISFCEKDDATLTGTVER